MPLPSLLRRLHRIVVAFGGGDRPPLLPRRRARTAHVRGVGHPPRRGGQEEPAAIPLSWLPIMLHSEHGPLIPLVLELRYDQLDPLAVHLGFHSPTGCTSRWRVSRDLLQAGTHCGAGHADVRVWPADEASGQDSLFLRLGSDERTALIEVRRAPFRHWLAHTFTVVPAGQEMAGVDWAEEIRLLLRNG